MSLPILYQLMASHRCEAARWSLDAKALPYVVRSLLPGPHVAQLAALTRQTQVPALSLGDRLFVGTRPIALALDEVTPGTLRLLPAEKDARDRALGLVQRLEAELLDPLETIWLAAVLTDPEYAAALFALGRGPTRRRLYHAMFPGVRATMMARFRLSDASHLFAQRSRADAALDRLASELAGELLAPDIISLPVIAAASAVSWFVPAPWCPYRLQDRAPDALHALTESMQKHPVVRWATATYQRHRGVSMAENHEIEGSGVI